MKRISLLLIIMTLLAWIVGCEGEGEGEIASYDLTIASTPGGAVTTPGEGVFTYKEGTVVNLTAETEAGYRFINWTGDVGTIDNAGAAVTTITMYGNYSVMANFGEYTPMIGAGYLRTVGLRSDGNVVAVGRNI